MTKRQLIDEILTLNGSAEPAFLARFADSDLSEYLLHLRTARTPRLCGDAQRYERYFQALPAVPVRPDPPRGPAVQDLDQPVEQPGIVLSGSPAAGPTWRFGDALAGQPVGVAAAGKNAGGAGAGGQSWLF